MRTTAGHLAAALLLLIASFAAASAPPDPETTYTVRATLRLLNPVNPDALNDPWQTARIVRKTDLYTDVEFTFFPLLPAEPSVGNPDWWKDNVRLAEFTKPGVTCNYDAAMQRQLFGELKADGIDIDHLDDKAIVEKVSAWLLRRSHYIDRMFDTWFVDFPNGSPRVLPELRKAFEAGKGDPAWSDQQQFDRELLGRGMFENRTSGSCTSYAILQATVFKAIGIPTRIVLLTPIVDANDPTQLDLICSNIHHHHVRAQMLRGLPATRDSFTNHTINEVFIGGVGGRWVRLNYRRLDQPILDRSCLGLAVHTNTVNDWSEANYAATWGKRYGLELRDDGVSKTANPHRALALSDRFGAKATIDNPEVRDPEPKSAVVTRAYWLSDDSARPRFVPPSKDATCLYLMLHLEADPFQNDWHVLKSFLQRAPRQFELKSPGQAAIPAKVTADSVTNSDEDVFDIYLRVTLNDLAKMEKGIEYQLTPPGDADGMHWSLRKPIALTKPAH